MPSKVPIRREVLAAIIDHARSATDLEICGLLAGSAGIITTLFPAPNALASPTEFEISPRDLFRIFHDIRAAGLDHLGIYHSHPHTENAPSPRDIEHAYYPSVAHLIVSPQPSAAKPIRAFSIVEGNVTELEIVPV